MLKQTVDATVELSVEQFMNIFPRDMASPHIAYVESKDSANSIAWDNHAVYTVIGDTYFVLLTPEALEVARQLGLEIVGADEPAVAETLPPDPDLF